MTDVGDANGPRLRRVLEGLLKQTRESSAEWARGSREDAYVYSGTDASLVIQSKDKDGLPPFEVILLDGRGKDVYHWTTEPNSGDPSEGPVLAATQSIYDLLVERHGPASAVLESLEKDIFGDG